MSGVNFLNHSANNDYDFSSLEVYINDELTDVPANFLTAAAGDDIRIVSRSDLYPFFYPSRKDYIASIEEPLPFMDNADFSRYFYNCRALTSIPEGLFDNNPNVTSFNRCFYQCSLTSIPIGLFDNNTRVGDFSYCFYFCSKLTVNVQIGSTTTNSVNVTNFAYRTAAKGTVYCRAGSAAYNAFRGDTSANVNVLTY